MNEIDEFLRGNKPAVKDDPTFMLETRRRLEAVEGIKAEVDRQRSRGRLALVFALAIGLAAGVFAQQGDDFLVMCCELVESLAEYFVFWIHINTVRLFFL